MAKRTKTKQAGGSGAMQHLYDRYVGRDARQRTVYEDHLANADIARQIYELRTQASLSQRALAKRVGTTASVICKLEDADYHGHSLSMLKRIAAVLKQRVEIRFVPQDKRRRTA